MSGEIAGCKNVRVHMAALVVERVCNVACASARVVLVSLMEISHALQSLTHHLSMCVPGVLLSIDTRISWPFLTMKWSPVVWCQSRSHLQRSRVSLNVRPYGLGNRYIISIS
jgi:hypothetical protein